MILTMGITPSTLEVEWGERQREYYFAAPITPNSILEVKTQGGLLGRVLSHGVASGSSGPYLVY